MDDPEEVTGCTCGNRRLGIFMANSPRAVVDVCFCQLDALCQYMGQARGYVRGIREHGQFGPGSKINLTVEPR